MWDSLNTMDGLSPGFLIAYEGECHCVQIGGKLEAACPKSFFCESQFEGQCALWSPRQHDGLQEEEEKVARARRVGGTADRQRALTFEAISDGFLRSSSSSTSELFRRRRC